MTSERTEARGVLVTGASKGIGRAIALAFARQGDRVAVHYGSDATAARHTLDDLPGTGHLLVQGDLSDPDGARSVADRAREGLGGVRVLVNNAAVGTTEENAHPVPATSYADWQRAWGTTFAVNLFGAANVTFCVTKHMIADAAGGRVINVGSRGAFRGEPDHPAYGASKAALHALGQSLALSLAPHGIAVTSVAPGFTATERVAGRLTGPAGDALRAQSPFGRVGDPGEIAEAVVYLASGPAQWASGAVLDLNGASHLRT